MVSILMSNDTKISEWLDVMYIEFLAQFLFCYATALAFVSIALASQPTLLTPTRAVVLYMSAFPVCVLCASQNRKAERPRLLAGPFASTSPATKASIALPPQFRGNNLKYSSALFTSALHSFTAGDYPWSRIVCDFPLLSCPCRPAWMRTKMMRLCLMIVAWGATYFDATVIARKHHPRIFCHQDTRTFTGAARMRLTAATPKAHATCRTFPIEPRSITAALARTIDLLFAMICGQIISEIACTLRTNSSNFFHCSPLSGYKPIYLNYSTLVSRTLGGTRIARC
jgi:hypothetical protein